MKDPNENETWKWLTNDIVLVYCHNDKRLTIFETSGAPPKRRIRRRLLGLSGPNAAALANFIYEIQKCRSRI